MATDPPQDAWGRHDGPGNGGVRPRTPPQDAPERVWARTSRRAQSAATSAGARVSQAGAQVAMMAQQILPQIFPTAAHRDLKSYYRVYVAITLVSADNGLRVRGRLTLHLRGVFR